MNEAEVTAAAKSIACKMVESARGSGDDPICWVTSNASYPALRAYPEAERVWQDDQATDGGRLLFRLGSIWNFLVEELERLLEEAYVVMETDPNGGGIYVVDMTRFEFIDEADNAETLQAQYRMYNQGSIQ